MSDVNFNQLTAASGIDGSADYFPINRASPLGTFRINRQTFLGVNGQPVDTSTSQNLTNKVLDNTNTVTLKDTLFTLQDDGDTTKQAQFQLSGITTATTRTYTLPNASSTLADISTSQTLTNKTLTAPVINNGSITGTTITTDAIVGQSASTSGTIYGLSISSAKVGTNGIVTASITDAAVTPAKLVAGTGASWAWQSWTPTLTSLTLGNGTVTAKYIQTGKTVFFQFRFVLGSTSAVGTSPTISLPVTSTSDYGANDVIGEGHLLSAGTHYSSACLWTSTTVMRPVAQDSSGTYLVSVTTLTATVPNTWTTGDFLQLTGTYQAA